MCEVTKFCKDCKHYRACEFTIDFLISACRYENKTMQETMNTYKNSYYCHCPSILEKGTLNLVSGSRILKSSECVDLRADETMCGKEGKYWEQKEIEPEEPEVKKESWFQRWLKNI